MECFSVFLIAPSFFGYISSRIMIYKNDMIFLRDDHDLSQGWILANQCDVMKSYTHTHKTKQKQQAFNIKSAFASAPDHQSMIC